MIIFRNPRKKTFYLLSEITVNYKIRFSCDKIDFSTNKGLIIASIL